MDSPGTRCAVRYPGYGIALETTTTRWGLPSTHPRVDDDSLLESCKPQASADTDRLFTNRTP